MELLEHIFNCKFAVITTHKLIGYTSFRILFLVGFHAYCYMFQKNYIALKEADICEHQENEITKVSTVLSISRVDASILLHHYHW